MRERLRNCIEQGITIPHECVEALIKEVEILRSVVISKPYPTHTQVKEALFECEKIEKETELLKLRQAVSGRTTV